MSAPVAVGIHRLSFTYPAADATVLRDLSLDLAARTVTALLGPNGAGKTTLLNLILGWLKPQYGSITVYGAPLTSLSRRTAGQTMALLPQEEHVPFEYTILEYVLLGRTPHLPPLAAPGPEDREVAQRCLERAGIAHLTDDAITAISGGERQLVMLARALTQEPRLLLLDEPTSHLDLVNKRRLADLIRSLSTQGTTIVFTTHDPEFAAACADNLVLLGEPPLHGPVDTVLTSEALSSTFGSPVEVHRVAGRRVILW